METKTIKVKIGRYLYPLKMTLVKGRLELQFPYNPALIAEIKVMEGARYHGFDKENPRKIWSIKNSPRNIFQLEYLAGLNPYKDYDGELIEFKPNRPCLYKHQIEMAAHELTRKQCIIAGEMGSGKTLATIEAMEQSRCDDWWWIGPKSALYSVQLEFSLWKSKVRPRFYTYDALRKIMENWPEKSIPPQGLVLDESSRCKNPTAQRSQASLLLANMIREHWGDKCFIIEMSGSPAPKDPGDWWMQCEIARPGFIREGNIQKFKQRLAIIENKENLVTGGVYPHLVTWKDDENKCAQCGSLPDSPKHDLSMGGHSWEKSVNEVAYLYQRMNGLVLVKFKKDCLDLPDKRYIEVNIKPTSEMERLESLIMAKSPSTITALTLLRELSDGFQYKDVEFGTETCTICHGSKVMDHFIDLDDPDNPLDSLSIQTGHRIVYDDAQTPIAKLESPLRLEKQKIACEACSGTGEIPKTSRVAKETTTSPKEEALKELLDKHEECGRLVTYAGFTASIDKCVNTAKRQGWDWIRVDGRGWTSSIPEKPIKLLEIFQRDKSVEKLNFIGHPGSAGMGLNLTASPSTVYYSNDFNAESRIQSEDRIHRMGMDVNRGATIYDLIHLRSDLLVLNNLKKKRKLQDMSLGKLHEELASIQIGDARQF